MRRTSPFAAARPTAIALAASRARGIVTAAAIAHAVPFALLIAASLALPGSTRAQSATETRSGDADDRTGFRALLAARHGEVGEDRIDPVAAMVERIESGETVLEPDPLFGYLPAVLEELDIPLSSQSLVFSRTSLQVDVIAPWAPRAIYFNDDVYVGYTVDGLVLEIASVDPDGGSVFYTIDQYERDEVDLRLDDLTCKGCHATGITGGVPGVMVRSFLPDRMGNAIGPVDERPTDDRTPMELRFGGWYVTGTHTLPHAGNTRAKEIIHEIDQPTRFVEEFDVNAGGNLTSLEGLFDASFYPTSGSDIVALMVLAHQTRVHNLITIAAEEATKALAEQELMRLTAGIRGEAVEGDEIALSQAAAERIDYATRMLVRAMLFYRAAPIGQVQGTTTFTEDFAARGPRDSRGRSLRDFSLDDRLFEHPMSFLVYTEAWDALPPLVKDRAYAQIREILAGGDDPDFPLLTAERRQAILEILVDTKPEFAALVDTVTVHQ
jgi:hypothetical protein